jgi:hypothetical protein
MRTDHRGCHLLYRVLSKYDAPLEREEHERTEQEEEPNNNNIDHDGREEDRERERGQSGEKQDTL